MARFITFGISISLLFSTTQLFASNEAPTLPEPISPEARLQIALLLLDFELEVSCPKEFDVKTGNSKVIPSDKCLSSITILQQSLDPNMREISNALHEFIRRNDLPLTTNGSRPIVNDGSKQ